MKVKTTEITPALATKMLELNTNNRSIRHRHVSSLAEEIRQDRWKLNGDTICFSKGKLIDGQHRLHAVLEADKAITSLVVSELNADVFDTKDVGSRRSPGDVLTVLGVGYSSATAAALTLTDQYVTGRMLNTVTYPNSAIQGLMEKYPEMNESVKVCSRTRRLMSKSVLSTCHYLFAKTDREAADLFVGDLINGTNLVMSDPVYVLRERLMQNMMSQQKLQRRSVMALIIKCWNLRIQGKTTARLSWTASGARKEAFPIAR